MTAVGFRDGRITGSGSQDIGDNLVGKDYLIERYPYLIDNFRFAGLWLWGNNSYGQLGDNTVVRKSSPVQTIAGGATWNQAASFTQHSAAVKTDGTLWTWGRNVYGQLGNNTTTNRSSPGQTISTGTTWKQVTVGGYHTGAVKTDGTLWLWGWNGYGQLGTNNTTDRASPVQTITTGTNWKLVSAGAYHTAAIKTDGTLWTWGYNSSYGALGDNTTVNKSSPVQTITGGTNWKQVATGYYHTGAVKTDGTLWLWGRNTYGQLGDNTITHKSSPVQVVGAATTWKQVTVSFAHSAGIKTDGTLWLWGLNNNGQLGDNTRTSRSSPVQTITGGTGWRQCDFSRYSTAAIKADGTLWTWGYNFYGMLGDNTTASKSSPIQTVAGGTNWKQVSIGDLTVAIRDTSEDLW